MHGVVRGAVHGVVRDALQAPKWNDVRGVPVVPADPVAAGREAHLGHRLGLGLWCLSSVGLLCQCFVVKVFLVSGLLDLGSLVR